MLNPFLYIFKKKELSRHIQYINKQQRISVFTQSNTDWNTGSAGWLGLLWSYSPLGSVSNDPHLLHFNDRWPHSPPLQSHPASRRIQSMLACLSAWTPQVQVVVSLHASDWLTLSVGTVSEKQRGGNAWRLEPGMWWKFVAQLNSTHVLVCSYTHPYCLWEKHRIGKLSNLK